MKTEDSSFEKTNQAAVYKVIFKADFPGHDALGYVKALRKILFVSPLGANACDIVNKSKTTTMESALEELIYVDLSQNVRINPSVVNLDSLQKMGAKAQIV